MSVEITNEVKAKTKIVRNFIIANELIQLGFPVKKIVQDKKYPEQHRPIYIFDNVDGFEEILSGLIIKATKEREARLSKENANVGDRPSAEQNS